MSLQLTNPTANIKHFSPIVLLAGGGEDWGGKRVALICEDHRRPPALIDRFERGARTVGPGEEGPSVVRLLAPVRGPQPAGRPGRRRLPPLAIPPAPSSSAPPSSTARTPLRGPPWCCAPRRPPGPGPALPPSIVRRVSASPPTCPVTPSPVCCLLSLGSQSPRTPYSEPVQARPPSTTGPRSRTARFPASGGAPHALPYHSWTHVGLPNPRREHAACDACDREAVGF